MTFTHPFSAPVRTVTHRLAASIVLASVAAVAGFSGCGGDVTTCTKADGCACPEKATSCDLACSGEGCEFTCPTGASCSFECESGSCKATGDSKSTFEISCAGGSCSVVCDELLYTSGAATDAIVCDSGCDCH